MCLKLEWYKTISMWMTLYHTHVCADVVEKYSILVAHKKSRAKNKNNNVHTSGCARD